MAGFLDEFYLDGNRESRLARLRAPPSLVDVSRVNALFGAIGERWRLGTPPKWTAAEERFLHEPYFMGPERMKAFLIAPKSFCVSEAFHIYGGRTVTASDDVQGWSLVVLRTNPNRFEPGK